MPTREKPLKAKSSHPKPRIDLLNSTLYKPNAYNERKAPLRTRPRLKIKKLSPTPKSLKALCLQLNHGDIAIEDSTEMKPIIGESKPHILANLTIFISF